MKIVNGLRDETNLPGMALLLIIPASCCSDFPFPDPVTHQSIDLTSLSLDHPDYPKWLPVLHTIDTGILMEEADSDDQGPLYKYNIDCFVPKDYAYRQSQMDTLIQMEHLVISQDQNGLARILGYTENSLFNRGALMKWKFSTGKNSKDRNGYSLSFYFESGKKAPVVTGLDGISIADTYYV